MSAEKKKYRSGNTIIAAAELAKYTIALAIVWTLIIVLFAAWNVKQKKQTTRALAAKEARSHFNKDQAIRFWATRHGGIYVPIDDRISPNPYLKQIPEQTIITPSGKKLTLMNPAYMLRQMMDEYSELYGVKGRITSLKPLRPENGPDDWERAALIAFEDGTDEVSEFVDINESPFLRLIQPMVTKKGCLKCHGDQGYKVGDIRGGLGVSVPMSAYLISQAGEIKLLVILYMLIWLAGALGIYFGFLRLRQYGLERVLAYDALKTSEEKYRLLAQSMNDIIYLLDNDRCLVQANSAFYKSMGVTPDQAIGRHIVEIIHPQGEDKSCPVCLAQEEKRDFVMIMEADVPNNPAGRPIEITVKIVRSEDGTPSGILMNLHDMTTARAAEQKLLDSEIKLATLLNATQDIAFLAESDGTFLAVNSALAKSLGVEKEELVNHSMFDFFSREEAEKIRRKLQKIIEYKKPFQWKDDRAGRYFDNSVYPIFDDKGDVKQIAVFARDITEKIKAEETLRRYEHIISATNDHMSFLDRDYTYLAVNDAYLIAHKKERSQITGHTVADLFGAEVFEQFVKEKLDRCLSCEKAHYQNWFDFPGLGQRYMDVTYYPCTGTDGIISGVVVSSHDITDLKQAEEQIAASLNEKVVLLREIHHRVKNNMQVIVSLLRLHGRRINDANLGKVFEDCRDRINAMSLIHEALYQSDDLARIDFKIYLKKLCRNLSQAYGASGKGIALTLEECGVTLDMEITLYKAKMEKEQEQIKALRSQMQNMESIGILAGGLAHDFNNLLFMIAGNIDLVENRLQSSDPARENLQAAQTACFKAKELTQKLIIFSKGARPVKEKTDIGELIKNSVLAVFKESHVHLEFSISDNMHKIEIDAHQIKLVVDNIALNAKEAMHNKGVFKVTCENIDITKEDNLALHSGKYIKISFKDQGWGIPAKNIEKIFDPYFSTKDMGIKKGQGLGLAVCHSIITRHDGIIIAKSYPGAGAEFIIYLPFAADRKRL